MTQEAYQEIEKEEQNILVDSKTTQRIILSLQSYW